MQLLIVFSHIALYTISGEVRQGVQLSNCRGGITASNIRILQDSYSKDGNNNDEESDRRGVMTEMEEKEEGEEKKFKIQNKKKKQKKISSKNTNIHKKGKLNTLFLTKSFIQSMFDPTCGGRITFDKVEKKKKKKNDIESVILGTAMANPAPSYGPVCGPNGCF